MMNKKASITWEHVAAALLVVIVLLVVVFVFIKPIAEGGSEAGKCETQGGTCERTSTSCPEDSIRLYGFDCKEGDKKYPCCRKEEG